MARDGWEVYRGGMWLSRRGLFRAGDPAWNEYIAFIGIPHLQEVRSVDSFLNPDLDGTLNVSTLDELEILVQHFEPLERATQYFQLMVHQSLESPALQDSARFRFLGYDLSDETHTSSLLNCGPWTGDILPLTERLNRYGLLTLDDAKLAQALLPAAWDNDPHADVEIWALFEMIA